MKSKSMMKFVPVVLLGLLSFTAAVAGEIKGSVVDGDDESKLDYVSIAIYNLTDSSLVTGGITDNGGEFRIMNVQPGHYYLEATFIGYEKLVISDIVLDDPETTVDLGIIELPKSINQLDEVEIVADELSVEYRIDKKVINASQQLTSAAGTAVDILQNLPSVTVDMDGTVALRGSTGFMVLIDGRPTVMDPSDALRSIPSNAIENIELITNPSAKYNPDGTAGIINIVTKKDKLEGFSGTANANVGSFGRYGGGALLNYTNKKWSLFLGADLNTRGRKQFEFDERLTTDNDTTTYVRSQGDDNSDRTFRILRGGVGYQVTNSDFLNFEFNIGQYSRSGNSQLDFDEGIVGSGTLDSYVSENYSNRTGDFLSFNGTYQHDFKGKGHNLVAQVQYRDRKGDDVVTNQLVDSDGNISSGQINTEAGPGGELQTNLDYVRPIGEASKIETGYQSRMSTSQDITELYRYNVDTEEYELQSEFSNDITYDRDIHSLYGIYGGEQGIIGYQAGIRGEYTFREVGAAASQPGFTIDRFDYFPSAHVSLQLPKEQQAIMSYSRRIDRPRSWYLEPFITWVDAFNVRQGNPGLLPEYINAFELNYLKGMGNHQISFETYYRNTQNKIERIRSVYDENVMLQKPENVGQDFALGGELVFSLNFFTWWTMDLSGNFYQYKLEGQLNDQVFDRESFNWNTRLNSTFKPLEGMRIQLNSRYNSKSITAQGTRGDYWTADIAVSQEFWKKQMTAVFQVRDMFGPVTRESTSDGVDFSNYSYDYNYAPQVRLTLNYRFNNYKQKDQAPGEGEGEGGDDF